MGNLEMLNMLVNERKESIIQIELKQKEEVAAIKQLEKDSLLSFEDLSIKIDALATEYAKVIAQSGDRIIIYHSKDAKNVDDKARFFIDILFFPYGHDVEKVGYNTALIEFEVFPKRGLLSVSQRVSFTPTPLLSVDEFDINLPNRFELSAKHLYNFLTSLLK